MITDPQALALAALLGHMRKDWNPQSVLALIRKNQEDYDFSSLARAAVNAAANPSIRTPAVIFMPGAHWMNPATATASERRLQHGLEIVQRAASRLPRPNPFDSPTHRPAIEFQGPDHDLADKVEKELQ